MDRRSFLKGAGIAATGAAATTGLAAPALAAKSRKLTMVTTWPRGFAGVHDSAQRFADSVKSLSGGALEIDLKAQGEKVSGFEQFDAVVSGQADMYHAADYYYLGQSPAFAFFTSVPFGMSAPEFMIWYNQMGGKELHHKLGAEFGIKSFSAGQTGAQAGGWYRNEMKTPDDFKGLKFRMPGLGGKVLTKMGASVQNIPGGEVYQALASGALDGTEWIGPWADEKAGFQEITKYYYNPGFHEPGAALTVATNLEVFESLTKDQQKIIEIAAGEAHMWNYAQFLGQNADALQRLIKDAGVQTRTFSQSIYDAFGKATKEVMAENMGDAMFKEVHDHYYEAMGKIAKWRGLSEIAYLERRNKFLGY